MTNSIQRIENNEGFERDRRLFAGEKGGGGRKGLNGIKGDSSMGWFFWFNQTYIRLKEGI